MKLGELLGIVRKGQRIMMYPWEIFDSVDKNDEYRRLIREITKNGYLFYYKDEVKEILSNYGFLNCEVKMIAVDDDESLAIDIIDKRLRRTNNNEQSL